MAEESTGFLKSVISAFSLVTAWTFVMGWTYLHSFYSLFGININSLDFPVYQYLVFCYTQFTASFLSALGMSALMVSFFLLTWAGVGATKLRLALAVSIGYLLLFGGGFLIAVHNARTAAIRYMSIGTPLPKVMLETGDAKLKYAAIDEALESSDLRLLLETKDQIFVFRPVDTVQPLAKVRLIAIDRHSVPISMRTITVDTKK
jgi:hypothetical protein